MVQRIHSYDDEKRVTIENVTKESIEIQEDDDDGDLGKCSTSSTTATSEYLKSYTKRMKSIIYPLVNDYDEIDRDVDMYAIVPSYQQQKPKNITLNLTPIYGTLLPYECQVISICYNPKFGKSLSTVCNCYVEGGKTRTLKISGSCIDITYVINKTVIEAGLQVLQLRYVK